MRKPSKIEDVRETGGVRLTYACPFCGKETVIELNLDETLALSDGLANHRHIQDIFPKMDATNREVMVSGMCPKCQDKWFNEPEEDDEEYVDEFGNVGEANAAAADLC
jgi:hypothetical protein